MVGTDNPWLVNIRQMKAQMIIGIFLSLKRHLVLKLWEILR